MNAYRLWDHIPETLFDQVLGDEESTVFEGFLGLIATGRNRVARRTGTSANDLLVFNQDGSRPPLCWCFNNWAEPVLLAHQLDRDQPLYAMHSLHAVTENWQLKARYNEPIASRYLDALDAHTDRRDLVFGGNCQGAPVAESMAIQYAQRTGRHPLLVTLDYIPRRWYRGSMFTIFGKDSYFNPFLCAGDPLAFFAERHSRFSMGILDAAHGHYFREPGIGMLKGVIDWIVDYFVRHERVPDRQIFANGLEGKNSATGFKA